MTVLIEHFAIIMIAGLLLIGIAAPVLRFIKYWHYIRYVLDFKEILENFHKLESEFEDRVDSWGISVRDRQNVIQQKCFKKYPKQYAESRQKLAESIPKIRYIASHVGIDTIRVSYPAPAAGGPMIEVCIFNSALEDLGHVETRWHTRFDTLNKLIGALKIARASSLIQIFNPVSWLTTILKIPFFILKATGFNVDKIEDSLWGHLFKLLFLIGLIYAMLRYGFTAEQISTLINS